MQLQPHVRSRRRMAIGRSLTVVGACLVVSAAISIAAPGWADSPPPPALDAPTVTPDDTGGASGGTGINLGGDGGGGGTGLPTTPPVLSSFARASVQSIATNDPTVRADLAGAAYTITDTASWDVGTTLVGGIVSLTLTTPTTLTGTWSTEADSPGSSPPYTTTASSFTTVDSATEIDVWVSSSLGSVVAIEPQGASTS